MAYENQFKDGWGEGDLLCGKGSLEIYTLPDRKKLEKALFVTDAKSILEIGCGDLVWHGKNLPDIDYYGIDLHERDTWEARREQGAKLSVNDAADPGLSNADLIVARDVFIHLSNDYIIKILENLKTLGKWLLVSHDPNADGTRGGREDTTFLKHAYGVNFAEEPFNLTLHESQTPLKSKGMALFNLNHN